MTRSSHFEGKTALGHLFAAREKGYAFTKEAHGSELSGWLFSALFSIKEIVILFFLLLPLLQQGIILAFPTCFLLLFGFSLWRGVSSAIRGFSKLDRLHQLIEEERFEITHHREEEKEELYELYRAKGFSGKILEEIITTLMSDDSRLLEVMLVEEIGLKLENYEHPLKSAFGALIASFLAAFILLSSWIFFGPILSFASGFFLLAAAAYTERAKEKLDATEPGLWLLSLGIFLYASTYFLLLFLLEGN